MSSSKVTSDNSLLPPKNFDEVLKCLSLIGGISLNYHHLLEIPSLVPSPHVYVTHDYVTPALDLMPSFGLLRCTPNINKSKEKIKRNAQNMNEAHP